ncbi:MAG TPA: hypothetical protein VGK67_30195 [Myxococcales bacterium]
MTVIHDIGVFLQLDEQGFFRSAAADTPVQEAWRPALELLTRECRREAGERFSGFYVRGSVASATAVKGSSDLDTVVLLDDDEGERRPRWQVPLGRRLLAEHPFITELEVVVLGRGALRRAVEDPSAAGPVMAQWCFLLALWGRCLAGVDILPELGRFRPGPGTAYVMCYLPADLRTFEERLAQLRAAEPSPEVEGQLRRLCVWTCKKLLRSGAELAMVRDGRFTRDLAPSARRFSERLPGHAADARQLLEWAIAPPFDLSGLERVVRRLEPVLVREALADGLTLEGSH